MTPFGEKIRDLRNKAGLNQKEMAKILDVTPAYLSALEHGHRGQPSWAIVQKIIRHFNLIWDDAEEIENLARISHPKMTVDTSGLDPEATKLINLLARNIRDLSPEQIRKMLDIVDQ